MEPGRSNSLVSDLVPVLGRETVLILDDYQSVDDQEDVRALIERLIAIQPPLLHLVLSTRLRPELTCMPTLRARGELLEIGERDLAFTQDEIAQLFGSAYGQELRPGEAPVINEQTGGWAIALQLVWQSRQAASGQQTPGEEHELLDITQHETLFEYLAREVLANQPPEIRSFLLRSSVLTELEPAACAGVLGIADAAARLEGLYRRGLFLTAQATRDGAAGLYRYHPLFHSFLRERAATTLPEWNDLHTRAAAYYREAGAGEQVMYHLLATGDTGGAALELEHWAPVWLESGRLVTLLAWTDQLPASALAALPQLLIARGDAARLLARFDTALRAYEQALAIYEAHGASVREMDSSRFGQAHAGQARALRGQALVFLDTLQPVRAEALLRRAFRLLPSGEQLERAELLCLIAENRLNGGRADRALRILDFGPGALDPGGDATQTPNRKSRIRDQALLHLGRLSEARTRLEAELPADRASVSAGRPAEAHREVTLLLSLIGALEGDPAASLRYAQEALEAARRLGSALFEAGARICTGHALQLANPQDYQAANEHYLLAMTLADTLQVQRTKAEAYMGLALLHGFRGDLAAAVDAAHEGLRIVEQSGDEWTAARLRAALGIVATVNGAPGTPEAEARGWLDQALKGFRASRDTYGQAVVHLWLSIGYYRNGELEQATHSAAEAFAAGAASRVRRSLDCSHSFWPARPDDACAHLVGRSWF